MPRGKQYPEELREQARQLRREGCSLNEIAARLGPPKNTLTLWVRDIVLTPEQRGRLHEKEVVENGRNRALASEAHRRARLARIDTARLQAEALLDGLDDLHRAKHIAAAMLYLGEGAKREGACAFGNSNPRVICYWLHLLRTSFSIDESKLCIQLSIRYDQDEQALLEFWQGVTMIERSIKGHVDRRTEGKPTKRTQYKGVCTIHYFDISLRRYLDALAQGLMARALDGVPIS